MSSCPLCNNKEQIPLNYNTRNMSVKICMNCSHEYLFPLPTKEEINKFYTDIEYFHENCNHQEIYDIGNSEEWRDFLNHRMNQLSKFLNVDTKGKILEIGCLEGRIINEFQKLGYDALGLEVNEEVVSESKKTLNVNISSTDLLDMKFDNDSFDLVYSFHVFEHLSNPLEYIIESFRILKPNGYFFMEVPWDKDYDNPHHFHFFTPLSVKNIFDKYFSNFDISFNTFTNSNKVVCSSMLVSGKKIK